ncbi:dynein regulatory complex protein 9-like [Periplaneta americana]|uniref:dynein regulatory complex protein 9-like n=1 Tax=Periplaneta americana TaxID=6978 RepID=UPI0037E72848
MKSNQSYNCLAKSTENIEQRKLEEEELHLQHVANKMMFQNMRMKTSLDRKMQEVEIRLRTRKIASLQNEVHDATVTSQMKLRFVSHWERTREEQNKLRLGKLTDVLKERLQTLEEEQQKEYRVNMAIRRYMDMSQMELLKQVETWMDKYDQDMEIKDHNIFELEFKRLKQQQRYTELRELLEQQRDDMHGWLIYKEEKRSKEEREAMATRIQTWWRDVMVRRGLGLYAKGKSKSKKGKKDKKKGGKKEKAKKKK